ncbi:MAG: amidohydrolase family protein [Planctomycetota bacterium]
MKRIRTLATAAAWTCGPGPGLAFVGVVACVFTAAPVHGQDAVVAIQNATIITGDGQRIENGTILFAEGKITGLGPRVSAPFLSRKIPGKGKVVTPGLIDAYTTLGLRMIAGPGNATARAADGFDRYAEHELRGAWRDGVTTVYVPARAAGGVGGYGSVIRIGAEEPVLKANAALGAAVDGGDGRQGPLARIKAVDELRRRFQAAQDYRTAWEDYRENLKEYEKKLAEGNKAAEEAKPAPATGGSGGGTAAEEPRPRRRPPPDQRPQTDKPPEQKPAEAKEAKKDDDLKKPAEPAHDRQLDELLKVLSGEVRLRVEANEPADILNLLDMAAEFNIALVLDGASGAHLVAERLAKLNVPVVLRVDAAPVAYVGGAQRHATAEAAARLQAAGLDVYFGSGVLPSAATSPQLTLRLARAVGAGFKTDDAIALLTAQAARLLGVEQDVGRLADGMNADLVVWSGDPLAPDTRVERVFVDGREVYRAGDEERGDRGRAAGSREPGQGGSGEEAP